MQHWFEKETAQFDVFPERQQPKLRLVWRWTTPQMAAYLLKHHHSQEAQRYIRKNHLNLITDAMSKGNWDEATPAMIVFDEDGLSADGQHRLKGVVSSEKAQWFLYALDMPKSARKHMDLGAKRSAAENLSMSGGRSLFMGLPENVVQAVARCFAQGMTLHRVQLQVDELEHVLDFYDEGLKFALSMWQHTKKVPGLHRGMISAIIARAYYHVPSTDRPRLEAFYRVVMTGEPESPADKGALLFREFLIGPDTRSNLNNNHEIYAKGCKALQLFIAGERLDRLVALKRDPYPTSESVQAVVDQSKKLVSARKGRSQEAVLVGV